MQAVDAGTRILPSIARGDNFATDSVRLHAFSFFSGIADMVTVTDTRRRRLRRRRAADGDSGASRYLNF
jgi:hypothetical protein